MGGAPEDFVDQGAPLPTEGFGGNFLFSPFKCLLIKDVLFLSNKRVSSVKIEIGLTCRGFSSSRLSLRQTVNPRTRQQAQPETSPQEPEEPEEILGSDDEEQEDPHDYCKGDKSSIFF